MQNGIFSLYKRFQHVALNFHVERIPFVLPLHRKLYQLTRPASVEIDEMTMFLNPSDKVLSEALIRDKEWEVQETKYMKQTVKPGWTVVDIGANIGYFTLLLSQLVGHKGKVYAFEPDPENFRVLEKNVMTNNCTNVIAVRKAISNTNRPLKLFMDEENKGDHRSYDSHDGRKSITIKSTTLDTYFRKDKETIDFIKMDIQGSEGLALLGMKKTIKRQKKITLLSEFWPFGIRSSGMKPNRYISLVQQYGFTISLLDDQHKKPIRFSKKLIENLTVENKDYTNFICKKSS